MPISCRAFGFFFRTSEEQVPFGRRQLSETSLSIKYGRLGHQCSRLGNATFKVQMYIRTHG